MVDLSLPESGEGMAILIDDLGQKININVPPQRIRYFRIRSVFYQRAENARKKFIKNYNSKIKSLDELVNGCNEVAWMILDEETERATRELVALGGYSISQKVFIEKYFSEYNRWDQAFSEIYEKFAEITMTEEELDAYREARREGRGRVIGGGFGIDGAVKGMITAGAANLAVGTVHAAFNGLAKIGSSVAASLKKSEIFADEETLDTLAWGLQLSVINIHYAFINAANDVLKSNISGWILKKDVEKADAIFENINTGRIPGGALVPSFEEIFTLDPSSKKYYEYILKNFGDRDGSLLKASRFFGVDISQSVTSLVDSALDEVFSKKNISLGQGFSEISAICHRLGAGGAKEGDAHASLMESYISDFRINGVDDAKMLIESINEKVPNGASYLNYKLKNKLIDRLRSGLAANADAGSLRREFDAFVDFASSIGCAVDVNKEKDGAFDRLVSGIRIDYSNKPGLALKIAKLHKYANEIGCESRFNEFVGRVSAEQEVFDKESINTSRRKRILSAVAVAAIGFMVYVEQSNKQDDISASAVNERQQAIADSGQYVNEGSPQEAAVEVEQVSPADADFNYDAPAADAAPVEDNENPAESVAQEAPFDDGAPAADPVPTYEGELPYIGFNIFRNEKGNGFDVFINENGSVRITDVSADKYFDVKFSNPIRLADGRTFRIEAEKIIVSSNGQVDAYRRI